MSFLGVLVGVAMILWTLMEAFEVMVLPRRVTRQFRFTRLFYRGNWKVWLGLARCFRSPKRRESCLSMFGPLSMLTLFSTWVVALIVGFALLHGSLGTPLQSPTGAIDPPTLLYFSGITFFTIGYGDVVPLNSLGRWLAVIEGGVGFGFLAVTIGYMPVLYQAFSRREAAISLLDARAGSPPSAGQFLLRLAPRHDTGAGDVLLAEWERWSAELLESHLSFPVLSYYRSQHDNQSWLAALTAILDSCALLIATAPGKCSYQAQLTFAMSRHAAVDLALVFDTPPLPAEPDRLPNDAWLRLLHQLREAGLQPRDGPIVEAKLTELRGMYEPFVNALARYFHFPLPPIFTEKTSVDNWQTSAWTRRTASLRRLPVVEDGDEHFD
ncbi:MAG TPA: potassium channel family protein [Gemmataceae bacterium]|nr:potassium channel family protein [Gemmataceae bacterium]